MKLMRLRLPCGLVLQQCSFDEYRAIQSVQDKARVAGNGHSLAKTLNAVLDALGCSLRAIQKTVIHVVASFVKGTTIPFKTRLVANGFLNRCIHQNYVAGVLDELEQENIVSAQLWLNTARIVKINQVSNLRKLHKNMFAKVWIWAGTYRSTGKNIGVDAYQIAPELKNLCDDVDTWIEFSSYAEDEIAARFHHRLLFIHPFPNGNGRHARLATDVLLSKQLSSKPFSWGRISIGKNIDNKSDVRSEYIKALVAADKGDYRALLGFVRS